MAASATAGTILLTTGVVLDGLKQGLGAGVNLIKKSSQEMTKPLVAIGATLGAISVAVGKLSKDSVSLYADFEQLTGGVETLFKASKNTIMQYADEAYRTSGLSVNAYMQNVTAFSASLLSSVGGDTEKAAEIANKALVSISDNVNKMGSEYESVQNAFQGFAKQQYMLLDNLKLGKIHYCRV